jgi:hypothetical protein
MKKVDIYSNGPMYCSACADSSLSKDEVEAEVNLYNPSGVRPWEISKEPFRGGRSNPCKCEEDNTRLHYLLTY